MRVSWNEVRARVAAFAEGSYEPDRRSDPTGGVPLDLAVSVT